MQSGAIGCFVLTTLVERTIENGAAKAFGRVHTLEFSLTSCASMKPGLAILGFLSFFTIFWAT